ncbi:hypothetical protein ABPG74_001987 [Tetrahymena malaccensis]
MKHLSELQLTFQKNTNLKLEGWRFLFKGLGQLSQLENLEIEIGDQCFLEDQGLSQLALAILCLLNLKKLTIVVESANFITSSCVKNIVDNLQCFSQLIELKLQFLEYQIEILEEKINIWSGLCFLQQINSLDLSLSFQYNHEKDIDEFFSALLSLKNLTQLSLNLDYNQQDFDFIEKLAFNLSQMTQLKELCLGLHGNLKDKNNIFLIFTFFRRLINLEKLDLKKCMGKNFYISHANDYYESLSYLPNLRDYQFEIYSFNKQIKESENIRINCLKNKQNLRNLSFSILDNLNDEQIDILNQALQNNKQMECLQIIISNNNIENKSFYLFQPLCSLQQLKQLKIHLSIYNNKINWLNQIIQDIGSIKSLQNLEIQLLIPTPLNQNKEQIFFSSLKFLNLNSFEFHLDSVIQEQDFQELGLVLQNQKQLQKLVINIQIKQYQNFDVVDNMQENQQQEQNQFQIESIDDFIEGIKSLQNLKELQYGISHSANTQALNPILESLSYLKNLENFQLLEDRDYEQSQLILLSKSLSNLSKLKQVKFYQINQISQETLQNQIQYICNISNLQQLHLTNNITNMDNTKLGIEKSFANLSELQSLELSIQIPKNSELLFEDIINGIGQLNKLQQLTANFGSYQFTDTGSYHFSQACSGLQNLIDLNISTFYIEENITSKGVKFLNEGFSKLKKLKTFDSYFVIPKLEFSKIVEGFFRNKCLKKANIKVETQEVPNAQEEIKNEEFTDQNIETKYKIDHQLTKMTSYFDYSLRQQVFDISKFYENFVNLSNLNQLLVFHYWDLGQDYSQLVEFSQIFKNLALAFEKFKKLQHLTIDLNSCQFDLEKIPIQNIQCLSQLNSLDLKLNLCSLQSDYILFDQFRYLNLLQNLNICIKKDTKFGKQAAISLGSSFMHLKRLQKLHIILDEGCQIESEGAAKIGTGLGFMKNLTDLQISISESCKINENGAMKLGEGISQLFALKEIRLSIQKNNNITEKAGAFLMTSLKNKKYLEFLHFTLQQESNEQTQEFIDELSKIFEESKLLNYVFLQVSFSEQLLICPDQIKKFVSQALFNYSDLQIINKNEQIQTTTVISSEQQYLYFLFTYNGNLVEFNPKIEFELLQQMEKNQKISIKFDFSNNEISNNKTVRVKEQIQKLKVKDLDIRLSFYQFSQNYLDEIILPAIKNENLLCFRLGLIQEQIQEIDDRAFMQIAEHLSLSNLLSLGLQFDDKTDENLFSDKYTIILKYLWNSKNLKEISLLCPQQRLNKLYRNAKYVKRIVKFQTSQFLY